MRHILLILSLVILSQCKSIKIDKDLPLSVTKAICTPWVGSEPGVTGVDINIIFDRLINLKFKSVYFKGKVTPAKSDVIDGVTHIVAYLNTSSFDEKKERTGQNKYNYYIDNDFPFSDLEENELVISYYDDKNKLKFFKVDKVKKTLPDYKP